MNVVVTPAAAKELGRALRFMRTARNLTLRDTARKAELSSQYTQNVERGERLNVSQEVYSKLAKGLDVPESVVADFVLRARIFSALEERGLTADQQAFVWRGVEQRLEEADFHLRTDLAKIVADMMLASPPARAPEPEPSVEPAAAVRK